MDLQDQLKKLFPNHQPDESYIPQDFTEKKNQETPLICKYEKKGRNGKPVTLIEGFEGTEEQLKSLAKEIKSKLGVGGTAKDGIIVVQGNYRDKIMQILSEKNYKTKRVGG